ncbi:hypothetical protein VTI28DRAFT_6387 [Corynascus sepedonium]
MAVPIRIKSSDLVVPTGIAVVLVKIDREAFRHPAPSMNPLSEADTRTIASIFVDGAGLEENQAQAQAQAQA